MEDLSSGIGPMLRVYFAELRTNRRRNRRELVVRKRRRPFDRKRIIKVKIKEFKKGLHPVNDSVLG
jgi:hypothetical protein